MSNGSFSERVEGFTKYKISSLLSQAKSGNTKSLAELRRGIGKRPGDLPQLWGCFLEDMPEQFYGDTEPSRAEWAVYIALTMFAMHQQGKDPELQPMQTDGNSLGIAMLKLAEKWENRDRVAKRFNTIVTSESMEELSHHLRGAVHLLKGENIGLDYPQLAVDIFRFQNPNMVSNVRLRWGRDFYKKSSTNKNNGGENE